jgi:hypothetical protein
MVDEAVRRQLANRIASPAKIDVWTTTRFAPRTQLSTVVGSVRERVPPARISPDDLTALRETEDILADLADLADLARLRHGQAELAVERRGLIAAPGADRSPRRSAQGAGEAGDGDRRRDAFRSRQPDHSGDTSA